MPLLFAVLSNFNLFHNEFTVDGTGGTCRAMAQLIKILVGSEYRDIIHLSFDLFRCPLGLVCTSLNL